MRRGPVLAIHNEFLVLLLWLIGEPFHPNDEQSFLKYPENEKHILWFILHILEISTSSRTAESRVLLHNGAATSQDMVRTMQTTSWDQVSRTGKSCSAKDEDKTR